MKKKWRWVKLWVKTGRGLDCHTYKWTCETDDAMKYLAEDYADQKARHSESVVRYGWEVVRKPPQAWLTARWAVCADAAERYRAEADRIAKLISAKRPKLSKPPGLRAAAHRLGRVVDKSRQNGG